MLNKITAVSSAKYGHFSVNLNETSSQVGILKNEGRSNPLKIP